ncbi:uncharacterized protein METZ01_LOCUS443467, partial [marine metagenome]
PNGRKPKRIGKVVFITLRIIGAII